jgi:hypothetical protein
MGDFHSLLGAPWCAPGVEITLDAGGFEVKSLRGYRVWCSILAAVDTDRGYRARSRPVVVCKCAPPVELDGLAVIRNRPAKSPSKITTICIVAETTTHLHSS